MGATWWAPHGTPPPRDMDRDGVPISVSLEGVTRWDLIGYIDEPPLPTLRLEDLDDQ